MDSKQLIWGGMILGSALGGFLPILWGSSELSMASIVLTAVGGFLGIYIGYKISR